MYNTMITLAVLLAGLLITYAINESVILYEEYCEWLTRKRREKYRKEAYTAMHKRQTVQQNREALWNQVK